MTRSRGKQTQAWLVQVVHIAEPDITSAASLVLLMKQYFMLDKSVYTNWRMTHIRRKWMKQQLKTPDELGGLTCAICGKKGLKPNAADKNQKATLDHRIEIADGGNWRDPLNFQVACAECNSQKNNIFQRKFMV
jgi:hypothetical protein